jgi:holliday junction DNA helicase RuvA
MIGYVDGKIVFKGEKYVILSTGGVGYKIFVPVGVNRSLELDKDAKLWTHLHVREDAMELYGFLYQTELEFFVMLISVSGIGPKSALGVLAVAPIDTLKRAISSGDTSYLTKVSGIGRKIAEKIILELKDKIGYGKDFFVGEEMNEHTDILDALVSLGYQQKEAREMIQKIPRDIKGRDKRLKEALKK